MKSLLLALILTSNQAWSLSRSTYLELMECSGADQGISLGWDYYPSYENDPFKENGSISYNMVYGIFGEADYESASIPGASFARVLQAGINTKYTYKNLLGASKEYQGHVKYDKKAKKLTVTHDGSFIHLVCEVYAEGKRIGL